jgi:ABC-2 type transport system permease protein
MDSPATSAPTLRDALEEHRVPAIPAPILQVRAILARAYVRIVGVNRDVLSLVLEVTLPLFSICSYALLYRALEAPPRFLGYVILGGAMTAFWLNVLWGMASQFYWEKRSGNLPLYLIAPMSRMSLLAGMAVGGLFSTTLRAVSSALIGCLLFDIRVETRWMGPLVAVFVLTMAALYGLGMMASSLFLLWGREAWHLSNLLQEPVYLLAGFYFPVRALGPGVATLAGFLPITLGLDAMRQLLFTHAGEGLLPVEASIGLLAVQAVAYFIAARWLLARMEALSRRDGTLTSRYQ